MNLLIQTDIVFGGLGGLVDDAHDRGTWSSLDRLQLHH